MNGIFLFDTSIQTDHPVFDPTLNILFLPEN